MVDQPNMLDINDETSSRLDYINAQNARQAAQVNHRCETPERNLAIIILAKLCCGKQTNCITKPHILFGVTNSTSPPASPLHLKSRDVTINQGASCAVLDQTLLICQWSLSRGQFKYLN
jgi:hypothetical protein